MFDTLVLSLPTRNSTLRMRVWRALKDSGCAVLRDGVYLLPAAAAGGGVLGKLEQEIRSYGGFALRLEARPGDEHLPAVRALFDRTADYAALVERAAAVKASLASLGPRRGETAVRRMEQALQKIARIDFFPGRAKEQATTAITELKSTYRVLHSRTEPRASKKGLRQVEAASYQRRVWATRKSPWIDRLASAWLIKRFIDRDARFVWLERPSELPKRAVGFDFDGAEFTHVKNRVTFEVLLAQFGLEGDPALAAIGAAIHFLDVGGIPAAHARTIETLLKGAREKAKSDDGLLAEAMRTFDLLYSGHRIAA